MREFSLFIGRELLLVTVHELSLVTVRELSLVTVRELSLVTVRELSLVTVGESLRGLPCHRARRSSALTARSRSSASVTVHPAMSGMEVRKSIMSSCTSALEGCTSALVRCTSALVRYNSALVGRLHACLGSLHECHGKPHKCLGRLLAVRFSLELLPHLSTQHCHNRRIAHTAKPHKQCIAVISSNAPCSPRSALWPAHIKLYPPHALCTREYHSSPSQVPTRPGDR